MINVGSAAKYIREKKGLTLRAAAREIGVSHVHLNKIEAGECAPTTTTIEKITSAWGIDLYMLAVAKFSDDDDIAPPLRGAVTELRRLWTREIDRALEAHLTDSHAQTSKPRVAR